MTVTTTTARAGRGWLAFAGIMLMISGGMDFFDGLWAVSAQDTSFDALFYDNNIEAWGWFYIIVGIAIFAAGVGVFTRQSWAVTVGIIVASIGAIFHMFWIFVFPINALVLVTLNVLVLYALVVYGRDEGPADYGP